MSISSVMQRRRALIPTFLVGFVKASRGSPDGVIDQPNDQLGVILQFNPGGCPPLARRLRELRIKPGCRLK